MDEPPPETPTTSITTNLPSTNNTVIPVSKKSSSGLSTGAICGIAIPCIAALLGVAAAAAFVKGGAIASTPAVGALTTPSLPDPKFIDTSLQHLPKKVIIIKDTRKKNRYIYKFLNSKKLSYQKFIIQMEFY
jgi:hypothetical protein